MMRLALFFLTAILLGCSSEPAIPPSPPSPQPTPPARASSSAGHYLEQAKAQLNEGHFLDAVAVCQEGLKQDSTAVPLYNLMANAYAADGRYAPAIEALEHVVRLVPNLAIAHVNLGGIYTKLGQYADAEQHLRQALALDPQQPSVHRRLGEVYLGTDRYPEAMEEFGQALALYPEDATLYFFLGQALEGAGRDADALSAFAQAAHLDIGFPEALYHLAVVARKQGRTALTDSAMARFQHLQTIGKGDPEVPKQLKKLRASVLNAPEDPLHHFRLGAFFAQHEYLDEALNKFAKAASIQPPAALLNQMGGALLHHQRPDAALAYYQKALDAEPTYMPALINTATLLTSLKRHAEALAYYQKAVALGPQTPNTWYYQGLGQASANQPQSAKQSLEKARSLCPPGNPLRNQIESALANLK